MNRELAILGTRGIPASHGGFETFAERLALHLVKKGWDVTVYCQSGEASPASEDYWNGVKRVFIGTRARGALGTVIFDFKANVHAFRSRVPCLVLGYNTAIFGLVLRLRSIPQLINMDGIEWRRRKWGPIAKAWFYFNEIVGSRVGNALIADHPEIANHLARHTPRSKITTLAYGADAVDVADETLLSSFGTSPNEFSIVIARPEPENSVLEIVKAFSSRVRQHKLIVLGNFGTSAYHRAVKDAASAEVSFPGAIYDSATIAALRKFSRFYFHGHQVGGTNPSLVEALGAGCAVIAHDNKFNRWVAGDSALYFLNQYELSRIIDDRISELHEISRMSEGSFARFTEKFRWSEILEGYEALIKRVCGLSNDA